jgi:hypothetical protein
MAVTSVVVRQTKTTFIADVTFSADADTVSGNIAHGLGIIPLKASFTPFGGAETIVAGLRINSVDATNCIVAKIIVAAGSLGAVGRLVLEAPHSIT